METTPSRLNPYVGPRSFRTGETLYGRDRELNELLDLLIAERVVLLYAPSGAGKSSLVQAALVPRLGEEGFRVLPVMRVSQEPPASVTNISGFNRYVFSLLLSLEEALPEKEQMPLDKLAGLTLTAYLDRRAAARTEDDPRCDVLIFDQFEEILTVNPVDLDAKVNFFAQVGQALRDRSRWALFAMREDYIAGLDRYLRPIPTRLNNRFRLDMLEEAAARSAMQQPAQRVGVDFSDAAARKLANDLRKVRVQRADGSTEEQLGLYVEPVQLQVVCYRLWDRLPEDVKQIVEADVVAVGNVDSALSDYYAERVAGAARDTGVSERAIRDWVEHQLITAQGIRGQVLQGPDQGLDSRAVQKLLDAYLVRAEKRRGATWLELAHDRLIAPVQANNAAWREANLSTLQRQADLWEKQNRPDGLLLRDQALSDAEAWAEAHRAELTTVEQDYLTACRKARAAEQRERRNNRLIKGLAVAALIGLILAGIAAVIAGQQSVIASQNAARAEEQARIAREQEGIAKAQEGFAREQQAKAEAASQLAAENEAKAKQERDNAIQQQEIAQAQRLVAQSQSTLRRSNVQQLAMLLALAAQSGSPTAESENVLREGLPQLPFPIKQMNGLGYLNGVAVAPDGGQFATASDAGLRVWSGDRGEAVRDLIQDAAVLSVAYSSDGAWLVSGEEQQARIWETATGAEIVTLPQTNWVTSIAFSPDGQWLALANENGTVTIWKTADLRAGKTEAFSGFSHGNRLGQLRVNQVVFNADSTRLATASDDRRARIWDLTTNEEVGSASHNASVLSVAFSPDSERLVTGGADSTARVWDITNREALSETLRLVHGDWVEGVAFSPDGQTVATASDDGLGRVWNAASGQEVFRLPHRGAVRLATFSPNGKWLATASSDLTARLWDTATGQEISQMTHPDALTTLAYSPIGSRLVTADASGLAQLWDMAAIDHMEAARLQQKDWVRDAAFSADGKRVATASDDGFTAWLWDISGEKPQLIHEFQRNNQDFVRSVSLSPDGRWLAAASDDTNVWVWDVSVVTDTETEPHRFTQEGNVNTVAFSPDGTLLAGGGADLTARIWDVATGAELQKHEFSGAVTAVVFSSDGQQLAVSDADGYVTVLDAVSGDEVWVSPQSDYLVRDVAVAPDGKTIAAANDRYITVWQVGDNQELRQMTHDGEVRSVAFSPDGKLLASTSDDGTTRLWDAATGAELARLPHPGSSLFVTFSPDGSLLAVGDGNVAHVLNVSGLPLTPTADLSAAVCSRLTRNFTQDEWKDFFGDEPYRKICPDLP
jgi:WD40 repeat protein